MVEFVKETVKKVQAIAILAINSWHQLRDGAKAVVAGTILAHAAALILGGIAAQAALFSLVSLATIWVLASYFPKSIAWAVGHMAVADFTIHGMVIWFGVLTGAVTSTVGMVLLGFGVSATLRLASPYQAEFAAMPGADLHWLNPLSWFKKTVDVEVREVLPKLFERKEV